MITAVMVAPVVCILSALSLTVWQRSLEWVTSLAKNPSPQGFFKTIKPYMKQLDGILDRIMGGIFLNHSLSSRCFAEEYNGCRRKSYHKYKCYIDDGDCNCFDHSDSDEPRRGSSRQEEGCGTGEER
jgi:hypothetical protein